MTFNQWLKQEFGQRWQNIRDDLLFEDWTEDQISDYHTELMEKYKEECEDNGWDPEMDA